MASDDTITWRILTSALALILFAAGSWWLVNINGRLETIEAVVAGRGERIALLERQAVLNRNDIDKIAVTLDRINATLIQISYEHQQTLTAHGAKLK